MTDCFFFPNDPDCDPAVVTPGGDSSGLTPYEMVLKDEQEFLEEYDMGMFPQLVFLQVAASGAAYSALRLFRYQSGDTYYAGGDLLDTNWYKLANQIMLYGALGLFSSGFFTQLLDLFGIATYFNLMWWGWALGTVGLLASGVANSLLFWAYDRNYDCSMDAANAN